MDPPKVLIVENEPIVAKILGHLLKDKGCNIIGCVATGEDAIRFVKEYAPDIIFMDIKLDGEMDGINAAKEIQLYHDIPIIYSTGQRDELTMKRAMESRPHGLLLKPFDNSELDFILNGIYNQILPA